LFSVPASLGSLRDIQRGFFCAGRHRTMLVPFELQGHRGARGLKPENTLPSFEIAIDVGVTTIETDVHLTRDGVPILVHNPFLTRELFRSHAGRVLPAADPLIASLTAEEIRSYTADMNPNPLDFPQQDAAPTPLAVQFAQARGIDPYAAPTVADL